MTPPETWTSRWRSDAVGPSSRSCSTGPRRGTPCPWSAILRLTAALGSAGADRSVRAVVIAGAGPVFCSGHDLRELRAADFDAARTLFRADADLMRAVRELPQPVVARVQGPASAAGCHLVAACDLAVASSHATFAVPGPVTGLVGTTAMVEVGRLIGRRRAMQMVLTGAPISAATALEWGLVNAVVDARELSAAADAMALSASAGAPGTIALAKRGLHEALRLARRARVAEPAAGSDRRADGPGGPDPDRAGRTSGVAGARARLGRRRGGQGVLEPTPRALPTP